MPSHRRRLGDRVKPAPRKPRRDASRRRRHAVADLQIPSVGIFDTEALEAFAADEGKIVLILGGRGKQAPYAPLAPLVKTTVRKLILIGEDAGNIERELKDEAPLERAGDMGEAVQRAFASARPGDTVLLAPACASFDMFESFEHRGRVFKEEVSRLKVQVSGSQTRSEI